MNRSTRSAAEGSEVASVPDFLRAPGGVSADIEGRLAVSDSGHHRILVGQQVGPSFVVRHVIGGPEPGFADGAFDEAAFRDPRGLVVSGDMVIVADRGNHAIRMIDLARRRVATMAGTGATASDGVVEGDPADSRLRDPLDVLLHEYDLYVALAGPSEIWRLDLKEGRLVSHVKDIGSAGGDGAPDAAGDLPPLTLASDGEALYGADAASSTIVRAALEADGDVETLATELEQPSGIAWGQGNHRLWVSDHGLTTLWNVAPDSGAVERVDPFEAELAHPAGVASAGHLVFVADSGNDRVLRVDQVDKRVTELAPEFTPPG